MNNEWNRRRILQGAAVVGGAALLPAVTGPLSPARAIGQDREQSQTQMVPGGNGIIYSLQADGRLKWFRHLGWQDGSANWASETGREIGAGWQIHTSLLADETGQLFGLCGDGSLWWHRWVLTDPNTGAGYWAANTNAVIHRGFGGFSSVFGGWNGVIYAVDPNGDLYWFRYLAGDGTNGPGAWANGGQGALIATGRRDYDLNMADRDGVIYGVRHGATLDWFRYLAGDGSNGPGAWANDGRPIGIGSGWEWGSTVERFADAGTFYCVWVDRSEPVGPDHELHWYRLRNWKTVDATARPDWTADAGRLVGTGFTVTRTANLQGYADRWSARPGDKVDVSVSTSADTYQASLLRLEGPLPGTVVLPVSAHAGGLQQLQPNYRSAGCGWRTSFSLTIPAGAKSGFHVVQLTGPHGMRRYIPLVVRPAKPVEKVAVLLPFLTHNAYNHWGGHFQYSWDEHPRRRTLTTRRPFANAYIEGPGHMDVRFYGDLFLLRWLARNEIAYDCYQDLDLHSPDAWLNGYRLLILASHPEYWTPTMRERVETYLANGGKVVYTGGNGMYERVDLSSDGSAVLHRNTSGQRWLWRDQGRPESSVFGVAYNGASFMEFAPYQVDTDHPFLEGTGLKPGDTFGHTGYNFAASGWEVDAMDGAGPLLPGVRRIAHGTQNHGSDMVFWDKGKGGWVFSVGSLCFNGALAYDPAMSRLLRNAVLSAL
ncbi:N,N-dimethylformamidase beta subunit family domain-containing protein [Amycolatopsis sp. NPDC059021]|uniref:N,N-dimethylformamidase beta subunit family domain-containing protein n=1 Tax=Amycolatopsis sp. NPDC059021 TaxID=3346704 RepID=UPI0036723BC0